jgi:hypothetical protein
VGFCLGDVKLAQRVIVVARLKHPSGLNPDCHTCADFPIRPASWAGNAAGASHLPRRQHIAAEKFAAAAAPTSSRSTDPSSCDLARHDTMIIVRTIIDLGRPMPMVDLSEQMTTRARLLVMDNSAAASNGHYVKSRDVC